MDRNCYAVWRPRHSSLLYSVGQQLFEYPSGRSLKLPLRYISYARWNRNATKLILGDRGRVIVLDYRSFKIKLLPSEAVTAWWDRDSVSLIYNFPGDKPKIIERGVSYPLPKKLNITAASDDGKLCMARIYETGSGGMYDIRLLRNLGHGRIVTRKHIVRHIMSNEQSLGDFIVGDMARGELLIGLGMAAPIGEEGGVPYYFNVRTGRVKHLIPDDYSQGSIVGWSSLLSPPTYSNGKFEGVARKWIGHTKGNNSYSTEDYAYFTLRHGVISTTKIDNTVLAFAKSRDSGATAIIVDIKDVAYLMVTNKNRPRIKAKIPVVNEER